MEALDRAAYLLNRDVARARRGAREADSELRAIEAESAELAARLATTQRAMSLPSLRSGLP